MRCRNIGLVCILWACWLQLQCCPMPDWSEWKDIEQPLTQASRSGEFSFTAPHSARFSVQIKFPEVPKERRDTTFQHLEQQARKTYGGVFFLHILDGEERLRQGDTSHPWLSYEEENLWSADWFDAKAGHTYTIQVTGNASVPSLRTLRPVVYVTHSTALEQLRHMHVMERSLSAFLSIIGVILTFGGASRLPLRGWFHRKP